ncbi:ferritin family protein [Lagierella sp.]|uniref:rubrerythrin family protein n=1 Tax=Lagierella sp. TaxID=2849657 RepID=UPI002603D89C|nr:ferritin family protein [Lagierella sp.]
MRDMTQANLRSAYGGESQARNRYDIWGDIAKKDGYPNVARLFHCTADAEKIHAGLHFKAMKDVKGDFLVASMAGFGIGSTSENLAAARGGEVFEYTEMYPAYIEVAQMQGEEEAVKAMRFAVEAEKIHAELFGKAKEAVDSGKDLDSEKIYLCPVCGFVSLTGEEEVCPLCGCKRAIFVEY